MITRPQKQYIQNSKNSFLGSELEYLHSLNHKTQINLIASYIKAEDDDGNDLSDIANILASSSITYHSVSGFTFGSLLKYISSSKRSSSDTRDDMDSSIIFDQTISYTYKKFTASLIFKDLFDDGTYYALPQNSYQTDFYEQGRTILINASLEF